MVGLNKDELRALLEVKEAPRLNKIRINSNVVHKIETPVEENMEVSRKATY